MLGTSLPALAGDEQPALGIDRLNTISHGVMSYFGFGAAQADNPTDPQPVSAAEGAAKPELTAKTIEPAPVAAASLPGLPLTLEATAAPSVETPLHRLFCVE